VPRVAITGVGAVTAVGWTAAATAAALRAGISRPAPLRRTSFDVDELGKAEVAGYPIAGLTDGFEGVGLLSALAGHALRDLLRAAALDPGGRDLWGDAGLFLAVSAYRDPEEPFVTEIVTEDLAGRVTSALGLAVPEANRRVYVQGHAGALAAAADAAAELTARRLSRVLVVAADSLLRSADLDALEADGRLKTTDQPAGVPPGEAAAALLLEAEPEARRRGGHVLAWLERVELEAEPGTRAAGDPSTGRGLATAIRRCLEGGVRPGALWVDLNGETPRAAEWGMVLSRLAAAKLDLPGPHAVAASLGDTGAAAGAVALATAVHALARGWAGGDCLVCSSDDAGEVGAALVRGQRAAPA
jgi:3-oxoacyl-[acyl-carrier-protein] synthase-1